MNTLSTETKIFLQTLKQEQHQMCDNSFKAIILVLYETHMRVLLKHFTDYLIATVI